MVRKMLQTKEELEKKIEELDSLLGEIFDDEWIHRAIPVYRAWWKAEPENESVQSQLVDLLLRAGGDYKIRRGNHHEAQRMFRELLRHEPRNRLAHYRLGFLLSYQKEWERASRHFARALSPIRQDDPSSRRLTEEQRIKALCYQARVLKQVSKRALEEAEGRYHNMEDASMADTLDRWIEDTKKELAGFAEEEKPYVVITRKGRIALGREELDEYENELMICPENAVVVSFIGRFNDCEIKTAKATRSFSALRAQLLHLLMEKQRPVPAAELYRTMYQGDGSTSAVRRAIHSLRQSITPCFSEPATKVIASTAEGYRWNDPKDFYIFYAKDRLEQMDMLMELS